MYGINVTPKNCKGAKLTALLGGIAATIGVYFNGIDAGDLILVGAVVVVISLARLSIWPALKPQVDLYSGAYEQGYDQGFHDGRRAGKPVVVPLRPPDDVRLTSNN